MAVVQHLERNCSDYGTVYARALPIALTVNRRTCVACCWCTTPSRLSLHGERLTFDPVLVSDTTCRDAVYIIVFIVT